MSLVYKEVFEDGYLVECEWAMEADSADLHKMRDQLRAHAAALEELARLKAPVDDKRIRDSIAWLRSSYARDGASDDEQAASVIESLAAKVAVLEDANAHWHIRVQQVLSDKQNAQDAQASAEAELAKLKAHAEDERKSGYEAGKKDGVEAGLRRAAEIAKKRDLVAGEGQMDAHGIYIAILAEMGK